MQFTRILAAAVLIGPFGTSASLCGGTWDVPIAPAPNNDDYAGSDNPNFASFGTLSRNPNGDQLVESFPTGGTTEWRYRLLHFFSITGIPELRVELGFGLGDNFVSASGIVPELDFDYPFPANPAPTVGTYTKVETFPQLLNFSGGEYGDIRVSVDVPDLPEFVRDFYTEEELDGFPEGALPFTFRRHEGHVVPEPATLILLVVAAIFGFKFLSVRAKSLPLLSRIAANHSRRVS